MRIVLYVLILLMLILFPDDTANYAYNALRIWGKNIVPTLFPYMFFSKKLSRLLSAYRIPSMPAIILLGILGGSPSGAMLIASSSDALSRQSLYALCALCGTISPMFILGTLQTWTNDTALCRSLLLVHWLSALISAMLIAFLYRSDTKPPPAVQTIPAPNTANPLTQSVDAILQIGGCIICYSVLAGLIGNLFPSASMLLHAILEVSGGTHAICQSAILPELKAILLSAALGFGGISILAQNHTFLSSLGISMPRLVLSAILRTALSVMIMVGLFMIL